MLERSLPNQPDEMVTEKEALQQLEALLKPRIEEAERGEFSSKTFGQIKQEARKILESKACLPCNIDNWILPG